MQPEERHRMKDRNLFILNCLLMIEHSVILLMLGPLVPEIMSAYNISESSAGLLLGAGSLGSVAGPLTAGFLIDRFGMKAVVAAGLAGEAVLLVFFGVNEVFIMAIIINFMLIFFSGPAETSVNIIPAMIKTDNPGSLMNLVHLSFSIGAFITPLLIGGFLSSGGSWRSVYFAGAVPAIAVSALFMFSGFPAGKTVTASDNGTASATEKQPVAELFRSRTLQLGTLTLFLYVGAELGFSAWCVYYQETALAFSKMQASFGLSCFWIGIMIEDCLIRYWQGG